MGFSDTFTKDKDKEELLGYDDTAFYYFAGSFLLVVAIPWTFSIVYNLMFPGAAEVEASFPKKSKEGSALRYCHTAAMQDKVDKARRNARKCSSSGTVSLVIKLTVVGLMWLCVYGVVAKIGSSNEIRSFDPFQILGVELSATDREIKKAYRALSLKWHPDKNPDDPAAAARFIQITKANAALTDETAKANYEKYGNPDGPQNTKVGIGLPRFLLEKDNHLAILSVFFAILLFIVPMVFICYYQRTKNYAANGVMIETLQFLGYYINDSTRLKNCPELLAASAESRSMPARPTDNAHMKPLLDHVTEHKKRQWQMPIIIKNGMLLWGHMQRLHHHMTPELREDLDELLKYSVKITQSMIEIACMREWFWTAQALIEFRVSLIQALDVKASELLQIPHFNDDVIKHCTRGKNATNTMKGFLEQDAEQRKGIAKLEAQQLADVEAFVAHCTDPQLEAKVDVEDESEIVVGDIATVTVALLRKNLKEKEALGPVHAPFFPEPKFEEWWVFLVEGGPGTRIIAFERIRDLERHVEVKLRFQVSRPGKHNLVVHALCDSYKGLDQKKDLNFNVNTEDEVKREIIVHSEDMDLDQQPTLFQQFMGELGQDEESEEEEEEDKGKNKAKPAARNLAKQEEAASDSDSSSSSSDSDDDDDDKKK